MLPNEVFTDLARQAAADGIQQLVAGGIISRGGAVLLLKRPSDDFMGGIWELPSGKAEPDEAIGAALTREVTEETGLTVTAILAYAGSFDYKSGSGKTSRQFNFAVRVADPEPVKLTEHDDHAWAQVTEDLPVTDALKTVLLEYHARAAGR